MGKYLDEYIKQMLPELRTGGGATLEELVSLAEAIQADLEKLATPEEGKDND